MGIEPLQICSTKPFVQCPISEFSSSITDEHKSKHCEDKISCKVQWGQFGEVNSVETPRRLEHFENYDLCKI